MAKQYDLVLRILCLGDSGVGKTCVICRFAEDTFLLQRDKFGTTIGIDFKMKAIQLDGKRVRLQLWDTAGQERYETITKQYYRRAQGVLLVYDITNEDSFSNLSKWIHNIKEYGDEDVAIMLIANKSDMTESRKVSPEQGQKLAEQLNIPFYETSAKDDKNVNEAVLKLAVEVMKRHKKEFDRISLEREDSEYEYVSELLRDNPNSNQCCS